LYALIQTMDSAPKSFRWLRKWWNTLGKDCKQELDTTFWY
jgi:hypothetical protein